MSAPRSVPLPKRDASSIPKAPVSPRVSTPGAIRVIGLDPGTRRFGWGIVERIGSRLHHVAHGIVAPRETLPLGERLVLIERGLVEVLDEHAPHMASIEAMFFAARDPSAAAKLGHARGVGLLVCTRAGLVASEYPPSRVKRTVAGGGRADKNQVAQMVRVLLGLSEAPASDAADALAAAITHLQQLAPGSHESHAVRATASRGKKAGMPEHLARAIEKARLSLRGAPPQR